MYIGISEYTIYTLPIKQNVIFSNNCLKYFDLAIYRHVKNYHKTWCLKITNIYFKMCVGQESG